MAVKLEVSRDLAQKAIEEKIADLKKKKILGYSGKTEKMILSSKFSLKEVSKITIQVQKKTLPLNEVLEFLGWAKLTYKSDELKESVSDSYNDGSDYLVRGKTTLKDKDGYIDPTLTF